MSILFATKVVVGPHGLTMGSLKAPMGEGSRRETEKVLLSEPGTGLEDEAQEALSAMENRLRAALFGCGADSPTPLRPRPIELDADVVAIELAKQGFDFDYARTWAAERIHMLWADFTAEYQAKWEAEKAAYVAKCEEELKKAMSVTVEQYKRRRIIVTNIAADADWEDVRRAFEPYGFCTVQMKEARHPKNGTQAASIQFESEELALHIAQNARLYIFGLGIRMYYAPDVDYTRDIFDLPA
ncbi:uncharacterized protein EI97DRAFT_5650 [Westerdykella ornata]|uniref:RRM domain-containing protein n=1 Tax=Westerdykella ornata TaxID=318751 RepID=A0A6A6JWA4_WESOR|nr:uncharacterized protein EI97DRAFT_5650 [Westerdykella ornata]KAF2280687.1 hypothetical protein EI97DRAFT_5650 [Westerdykella ornata]